MRCDLFACCWMGSHGVPLPVPCHVPQTSRGVVSLWGQGQVVCSRLWRTETEFELGSAWLSTWWHPFLRHAECFQLLHAVNPSSSSVCITHLRVLILLGFKVCIERDTMQCGAWCLLRHGLSQGQHLPRHPSGNAQSWVGTWRTGGPVGEWKTHSWINPCGFFFFF